MPRPQLLTASPYRSFQRRQQHKNSVDMKQQHVPVKTNRRRLPVFGRESQSSDEESHFSDEYVGESEVVEETEESEESEEADDELEELEKAEASEETEASGDNSAKHTKCKDELKVVRSPTCARFKRSSENELSSVRIKQSRRNLTAPTKKASFHGKDVTMDDVQPSSTSGKTPVSLKSSSTKEKSNAYTAPEIVVATFTAELDRAIKAAYEAQDARRRTLMSKSSAVLTKAAVLQDQMEKLETELEIVMKEAHDTEAKLRVLQDEQLRLRTDTKNRFLEERRKALDLIEEA